MCLTRGTSFEILFTNRTQPRPPFGVQMSENTFFMMLTFRARQTALPSPAGLGGNSSRRATLTVSHSTENFCLFVRCPFGQEHCMWLKLTFFLGCPMSCPLLSCPVALHPVKPCASWCTKAQSILTRISMPYRIISLSIPNRGV